MCKVFDFLGILRLQGDYLCGNNIMVNVNRGFRESNSQSHTRLSSILCYKILLPLRLEFKITTKSWFSMLKNNAEIIFK